MKKKRVLMLNILYGDKVLFDGKPAVVKEVAGSFALILIDGTKKSVTVAVSDLEKVDD